MSAEREFFWQLMFRHLSCELSDAEAATAFFQRTAEQPSLREHAGHLSAFMQRNVKPWLAKSLTSRHDQSITSYQPLDSLQSMISTLSKATF